MNRRYANAPVDDTSFPRPPTGRGLVTVLFGCMFSGKTTELLRRLEQHPPETIRAFKHAIDTRYNPSNIVSHAGKAHPAIVVTCSAELSVNVGREVRLVAIDEGHFFDAGLADVVRTLSERGVDVVVATLQPDSWGRPFPIADALCELADEPVMLTATCARCGGTADRTQRLTPIVGGNMVGGPENYEPRCRACWRPPPEAPLIVDCRTPIDQSRPLERERALPAEPETA